MESRLSRLVNVVSLAKVAKHQRVVLEFELRLVTTYLPVLSKAIASLTAHVQPDVALIDCRR